MARSSSSPASQASDDAALAARTQVGDAEAFAALFHAYFSQLRAFANRFVQAPDVADEVVQDVFFAIWMQRERWVVQTTVRAYLYTAVRHRALGYLRHQQVEARWQERVLQDDATLDTVRAMTPAELQLHAQDLAAVAGRVLRRLSPRRREAYLLRQTHHLAYAEIAQIMGITETTVQLHISHTIGLLRRALERFVRNGT